MKMGISAVLVLLCSGSLKCGGTRIRVTKRANVICPELLVFFSRDYTNPQNGWADMRGTCNGYVSRKNLSTIFIDSCSYPFHTGGCVWQGRSQQKLKTSRKLHTGG